MIFKSHRVYTLIPSYSAVWRRRLMGTKYLSQLKLIGDWVAKTADIYFSWVWRLGSLKIKAADSMPGEVPLPGLQMATFLLLHYTWREKETALVSSFYKAPNLIIGTPSSWHRLNKPNYLPRAPTLNAITFGLRALTYGFWGRHRFPCIKSRKTEGGKCLQRLCSGKE